MDKEYLSQKQIAEKFGVSKQKIYRCIKANHIKEVVTEVVKGNNVLMYDSQAVTQIECILKNVNNVSGEVHREVHHDTVNEVLLKQLEVLNEQLKAKDKQIEDLSLALANVTEGLKVAQVLQANAEKKVLELEDKKKEEKLVVAEEPRRKWWQRNKNSI